MSLRTLALVLAASCARSAAWTDDAALEVTRAHMDSDGDGVVGLEEYRRVAWRGPEFGQLDADGDGDLSTGEIRPLLVRQDPQTFGDHGEARAPGRSDLEEVFPRSREARTNADLLLVLREEIEAVDPELVPASKAQIQRVSGGDLSGSPAGRELVRRFDEACEKAGIDFRISGAR